MESILNLAQNIWTSYPVAGVIILLLLSFPIIRLVLGINDSSANTDSDDTSFNPATGLPMMGGSNYDISGAPRGFRNPSDD